MTLQPSRLERAILNAFASEYGSEVPGLDQQLQQVRVASRENTGGGFFTDLSIDREAVQPVVCPSPLDSLAVRVDGITEAIGLMLFFEGGYAHLIEGYTFANQDTKVIDFESVPFGRVTRQWPKRPV